MKTKTICTLASFLMPFVSQCSKGTVDRNDISLYLPVSNELKIWNPVGQPQNFKGEDLFLYINGGAEIYHEYGFRQVITQGYKNKSGKSITLEIFEMENHAGAYGIYTFKTGDEGKKIHVGNEGLFEDYYLNFWQGNFLVTGTAFDSEKETVKGLMTIAQATSERIKDRGQKPSLIDVLPKENLKGNSIKYLKGNLGLFNHYEFDSENIFGLKEGVIGHYGNFEVFLFRYGDENESLKWYENAKSHLEKSPKFSNFANLDGAFTMIDAEGKPVNIELHQNYIIIILGTKHIDSDTFPIELKERIRKSGTIE